MRRVHINGIATLEPQRRLLQRRLHRRLEGRRDHDQRLAAAVADPRQHARRLDQRCLEPGVLRRGRRPREGVPEPRRPYTTLPTSPVTARSPYLYVDAGGHYRVFVPAARTTPSGTTLGRRAERRALRCRSATSSSPSRPTAHRDQQALARASTCCSPPASTTSTGRCGSSTRHHRARPRHAEPRPRHRGRRPCGSTTSTAYGSPACCSTPGPGVRRAGRGRRPAQPHRPLRQPDLAAGRLLPHRRAVGRQGDDQPRREQRRHLIDNIWAWRGDHGNGIGWTANTADTGVVVNGDDVTAYGLFVEHYQKYQTIWNGENGPDDLLPERDALRPAEPGRLDGGARRRRLGRVQGRRRVRSFSG